jgi:hypothetical protein
MYELVADQVLPGTKCPHAAHFGGCRRGHDIAVLLFPGRETMAAATSIPMIVAFSIDALSSVAGHATSPAWHA